MFALLYQLILFGVGIIVTENEMIMLIWAVLDLITGVLFDWIQSILVTFTTVLTGIYAVLIYRKNKKNSDSDSKASTQLENQKDFQIRGVI